MVNGSDWTELIKKQRDALHTFVVCKGVFIRTLPTGFGQPLCYALIPLVFNVLQGGESDSIASPLTSLMMEQREMEQRDKFATHEVCTQAATGSRHNRNCQGWKKCTLLARRRISSGLRCCLEESTVLSSV